MPPQLLSAFFSLITVSCSPITNYHKKEPDFFLKSGSFDESSQMPLTPGSDCIIII